MHDHPAAGPDGAASPHPSDPAAGDPTPAEHWESRYAEGARVWSGRPNASLVAVAEDWSPGRAVDLGCGEGADAIWLASRGWRVTAVDISPTAVSRGRAHAATAGVAPDRIDWVAADLESWQFPADVDLVSACFFQSSVALDRVTILRRAAAALAPGGHLLVVAHATAPPWAKHGHHLELTPEQESAALALDPALVDLVTCETRPREAVSPSGETATIDDSVLVYRRR